VPALAPSKTRLQQASNGLARTELEGGLIVATERVPWIRSVAVGAWVRQGPVHEPVQRMGASHLLEHMVFKGTRRRSAREIALELERRGGDLDAYTTREHTGYQARVLRDDLDLALDVIADLLLEPALRAEDLRLEREVVLEEIAGVEDTPDDLVFELHAAELWGEHPYGYSILGTPETVGALEAEDLRELHGAGYHRGNLVVAAVGDIEHERFVERIDGLLRAAPHGERSRDRAPATTVEPGERRVERDTAQTHLLFGSRTFGHADARRVAMVMLSTAFGGGMGSRLFQRVREELGLAYAVYAYQSFHRHAGTCGIYVGTRPELAERVGEVVREELRTVARDGLDATELEDARGQMKGQLALSLDSPSARLARLAGAELYEEPYETVDALLGRVEAVTGAEVAALAAEYMDPDRQVVVRLGPNAS